MLWNKLLNTKYFLKIVFTRPGATACDPGLRQEGLQVQGLPGLPSESTKTFSQSKKRNKDKWKAGV